MARKKVSPDVEADVIYKSNRLCCVDQKRGDHIHHIDGNNANSKFENLALLCFDCHNEASLTGSLRKKLTPKAILKFRDFHYSAIQSERDHSIKKFNHKIDHLTSDILYAAAKDAVTMVEIKKLKHEYFNARISSRKTVLEKFDYLDELLSVRTSYEILSFLVRVTYGTRDGMDSETARVIYFLATTALRSSKMKLNTLELDLLVKEALRVSFNMFYDSVIHLKNLNIAQWSLILAKNVLIYSRDINPKGKTELEEYIFTEFEKYLKRPERNDLDNTRELLKIFRIDFQNDSLYFPKLPKNLEDVIQNESL